MKILNLYCGVGGNRKLWGDKHEITAIESDPLIAQIYSDFFPGDSMYITCAHRYLLENYYKFDFIWSSPPCQTHFRLNQFRMKDREKAGKINYPDMNLYQEILLLQKYFQGKWVVENVVPYYNPLIPPQYLIDRHYFWCNFFISEIDIESNFYMIKKSCGGIEDAYGINLGRYKFKTHKDKRQAMRNCVNPVLGKHILDCAMGITGEQGELF